MPDPVPPTPDAPLTPLTSRFATRIHRLTVADRTIDLLAPTDPDALLDDPIVEQRYKADNYLPYWPIIWPSGLMLATQILTQSSSPPLPATPAHLGSPHPEAPQSGAPDRNPGPSRSTPQDAPSHLNAPRAIDLGCGLGTTGIAAALRGWHITLTDYDPEAVQFAEHNALRNGIPQHRVRPLHMDWRQPIPEKFPWVLASDVLYERRLHPLLLDAIAALLEKTPTAQAWVSDPQRSSAEDFPLNAAEKGFRVKTTYLEGESFSGGKQAGNLYILTWPKP